jgi:NTE family protein
LRRISFRGFLKLPHPALLYNSRNTCIPEMSVRHPWLAITALFFAFYGNPLLAQPDDGRIKIGLALSGGGARGGAHVGVLRALEELRVPIDYVAGTSMGAIIGGFYAAGYSVDEIERIMREMDWNRAMSDSPDRRDRTMRKKEVEAEFLIPYRVGYNDGRFQAALGAIQGQHLDQVFQRILQPVAPAYSFDALPIPFRAVATDLVTGEAVVLSSGSLADALRASMSVPGVFAPVRIDGRILVDGGMSNNLPVSVVREMGADIVIAVDISSQLLNEEQLTSVLSVTEQLSNFLTRRTTEQQIESLAPKDVLIVPPLADFGSANFAGAVEIIPLGYRATMDQQVLLAGISEATGSSDAAADRRLVDGPDHKGLEYLVSFVDIDNDSVLNDEIIRSRLGVQPGQYLDLDSLESSVDRIYSLDLFESVTYDLVENSAGEKGLLISANARRWGPNYLQFGLELSNDFSGNSDFKIGAGYTRNALNSLGGELRVLASMGREDELRFDFYQPVDLGANWFVNPQVDWKRRNYGLWIDDRRLAEYEVSGWNLEFGVGRNFRTTDQVRLDYRYGRARPELITGTSLPGIDGRIDIGELLLNYRHDSLDSLYFPTTGMAHDLSYRFADDMLGASTDYQQVGGTGTWAGSWGKNTVSLNYMLCYSFDDDAPLERWYQMGGFGRLSGLAPDQLSGRQAALASLALYRRLNEVEFLPAYAGVTLEAGNVWNFRSEVEIDDLRYSASAFIGAESPIGPLYFAIGHNDGGDTAVYFYVGHPFRGSQID